MSYSVERVEHLFTCVDMHASEIYTKIMQNENVLYFESTHKIIQGR